MSARKFSQVEEETVPGTLTTIDEVLPVLKTPSFIVSFIVTLILNGGINYLLDWIGNKNDTYPYWGGGKIIFSLLVYTLIVVILLVLGTGSIRKEVLAGKVPAIRRAALQRGIWRFLPLDVNDWTDRLPLFIFMGILLPCCLCVLVVFGMCAATSDGFPSTQTDCTVTRGSFLFYNLLYKEFICLTIMTLNFIAACNSDQPEFAPGWAPKPQTPRQKKACCVFLIYILIVLPVCGYCSVLMMNNTALTFDPPPNSLTHDTDQFLKKFTNMAPAPVFVMVTSNFLDIQAYNDTLVTFSNRVYNLSMGSAKYGPNIFDIQGLYLSSEFLRPHFLSHDNMTTLISINFHTEADVIGQDFSLWLADRLDEPYYKLNNTNLEVKLTGLGFLVHDITSGAGSDFVRIDIISLPVATLVLGYCLKSARILFIPLVNLPLSMVLSFAVMLPLTYAMDVSAFTPDMMAAMISALNIDYTLFLVSRFYEQVAASQLQDLTDPHIQFAIVKRTTELAAHNILVSGVTIALANAGIAVFPMDMLRTIGIGCCLAILCTVFINMTVTPIMLYIFFPYFAKQMETPKIVERASNLWLDMRGINQGSKDDFGGGGSLPGYGTVETEKKPLVLQKDDIRADSYAKQLRSPWFRMARFTVKHPYTIILIVIAIGVPLFTFVPKMKVTFDLFVQVPRNAEHLGPFREIMNQFGAGTTSPYYIPVDSGTAGDGPGGLMTNEFFDTIRQVQHDFANEWGASRGLTFTSIAVMTIGAQTYNVTWNSSVYGDGTLSAQYLLSDNLPPSMAALGTGYQFFWKQSVTNDNRSTLIQCFTPFAPMGGDAVPFLDKMMPYLKDYKNPNIAFIGMSGGASDSWAVMAYIMGWFPYQIGATFCVIFIFIAIAFRSIAVPVRMLFTVGYTVAFTYGLAVLVFQYEWLHPLWPALKGVDGVFWIIPVQCFTVICGLALDYDVFLLSRVVEYRSKGFSDSAAMCKAVWKTGRIISFAGLIMAIAFSSLVFSEIMVMNQSGMMLAVAVILDTFVVRTLFMPALMSFAPKYAFWPNKNEAGIRGIDDMGEDDAEEDQWNVDRDE